MKGTASDWDRLRVPRRRVPARLVLADGTLSVGELYADVIRPDGSIGRVADRLSDTLENYLPLAADGEHVLLNKAAIALVRLAPEEVEFPTADGVSDHEVRVRLSTGQVVHGTFRAFALPGYARVLDYLNRTSERFIALLESEGAVLVNVTFIAGVTEIHQHERISG